MQNKKSLSALALSAFLISITALALGLKADLTISHHRAALTALEEKTNKPEYKKTVNDLKNRIKDLERLELRPLPLGVSGEEMAARTIRISVAMSAARNMLDSLEGAARQTKETADNQIREKTRWAFIWYGLGVLMATVGAIVLRRRISAGRSASIDPLSVTGR
jgi:hypothetical protein